jgi:hypothetical protein
MNQAIVQIKTPCQVDLDIMASDERGRFCSVCQTSVVDFTAKTPEEISLYFLNHQHQSFCGTYNRTEVKTDDAFYNFISRLHTKKMKFLAVLIVGVLVLAGCKTKKQMSTRTSGSRYFDENKQSIENLK